MLWLKYLWNRLPHIVYQGSQFWFTTPLYLLVIHQRAVCRLLHRNKFVNVFASWSLDAYLREAYRYSSYVRTVSWTSIWCFPASHVSSHFKMSCHISCISVTLQSHFRITVCNIIKQSSLQWCSHIPGSYIVRIHTNWCPTVLPGFS